MNQLPMFLSPQVYRSIALLFISFCPDQLTAWLISLSKTTLQNERSVTQCRRSYVIKYLYVERVVDVQQVSDLWHVYYCCRWDAEHREHHSQRASVEENHLHQAVN